MNVLDTIRNTLGLAHGLAQSARFDPEPSFAKVMRPAQLDTSAAIEARIERLKAEDRELQAHIRKVLTP